MLTRHAYGVGDPDDGGDATSVATRYHREYLCLLHEIDPRINQMVAVGGQPDFSDFFPVYWTVNGRALPDDLKADGFPLLPSQPYGAFYMMHPGERALVRMINMGRDPHPWHTHTNHLEIIAHDGNVLQTAPSQGTDLARREFTLSPFPGQTFDAIFEWTGKGQGWDIYGHATADSGAPCNPGVAGELAPFEDPDDHCKPFPSTMPDPNNSTFGGFWSGSPFMADAGSLPPGEGGLNPWGGYVAIWHSHAEKELVNFDVFPGGMLTFMAEVPIWDPEGARNAVPY
jgi:hypothetical protein